MTEIIDIPEVKHGIISWKIQNFLLCFTKKEYTTASSHFMMAGTEWFFKLNTVHRPSRACLRVDLCRDESDRPSGSAAKVSTSLMSAEHCFRTMKNGFCLQDEPTFLLLYFNATKESLVSALEADDSIRIEFHIIYIHNVSSSTVSSYDLELDEFLLSSNFAIDDNDVCLMSEDGCSFPVKKEMLRLFAPVLYARFSSFEGTLCTNYSREVVEAIVKYLCSGTTRRVFCIDSVPPLELYECARKFGISELMEVLSPWRKNITNVIKFGRIDFGFGNSPFHTRIVDDDIHMQSDIHGNFRVATVIHLDNGMVSFSVTLERVGNFRPVSISATIYILDFDGYKRFKKRFLDYFGYELSKTFNFELEEYQILLIGVNLPYDILNIQCVLKFACLAESGYEDFTRRHSIP